MEEVVEECEENDQNEVGGEENETELRGNPRLANALAKAIRMTSGKDSKSIILSKAKLYSTRKVTKKSHGFEIAQDFNKKRNTEDEEDIKPNIEDLKPDRTRLKKCRIARQEKLQRGRLKPSPLDKGREKPLQKIATKGVVQLFNAVRQQQNAINNQINKPGITEGKKEKILKSVDKKAFLDVLMGRNLALRELSTDSSSIKEDEVKSEPKEEPSWNVLRDNFMMGAKLKDWDKRETEMMEE